MHFTAKDNVNFIFAPADYFKLGHFSKIGSNEQKLGNNVVITSKLCIYSVYDLEHLQHLSEMLPLVIPNKA